MKKIDETVIKITKFLFVISLLYLFIITSAVACADSAPVIPTATNPQTARTWAEFISHLANPSVDEITLANDLVATSSVTAANFPARDLTITGGATQRQINMSTFVLNLGVTEVKSMLSIVNINFIGGNVTTTLITADVLSSANWVLNLKDVTQNATNNTRRFAVLSRGTIYCSGTTQFRLTNSQDVFIANKLFLEGTCSFVAETVAGVAINARFIVSGVEDNRFEINNSQFTVRSAGPVYQSSTVGNSGTIKIANSSINILNATNLYTGGGVSSVDFEGSEISIGGLTGALLQTTSTNSPINARFMTTTFLGNNTPGSLLQTANATSPVTSEWTDSSIQITSFGGIVNTSADVTASFNDSEVKASILTGSILAGGTVKGNFIRSPVTIENNFTQSLFQVSLANSTGSTLNFEGSNVYIRQSTTADITSFNFNGQTNFTMSNSDLDARVAGRFIDVTPNAANTEINITNSSVWNAYSQTRQVIHTGNGDLQSRGFKLNIDGVDTIVNISGNSTQALESSVSGIVTITGDDSEMHITNGAEATIESLQDGTATSAILMQSVGGGIYVSNQSKLKVVSRGDSSTSAATIRFRLVGGMTFDVSENSQIIVEKYGSAPGIRMFGGNNSIRCRTGSDFTIYNQGRGNPANGGDGAFNQGILFASGAAGNNVFELSGKDSGVNIIADKGPAIDGVTFPLDVIAERETFFIADGQTAGATQGIFRGSRIDLYLNAMQYFDFSNHRVDGGQVFSSTNAQSTLTALNTELSVWRRSAGVNILGDPSNSFFNVDFSLSGINLANFVSGSAAVQEYFSANGGMETLTRVNGNNQYAEINEIRTPTNADKHIWLHASIPEGKFVPSRDAATDEVTVQVGVYHPDGSLAYEAEGKSIGDEDGNGGVSIYGEPPRSGIVKIAIPDGEFIAAGQTVKVLKAWRGPAGSSELVSPPEKIHTSEVKTIDVTPPKQASGLTTVDNALKQLKGTSQEEGAKVFVKVNNQWLKDSANQLVTTLVANGEWSLNLPGYLTTQDKVDVYLKDTTTIELTPSFALPESYTAEPDGVMGNLNESVDNYALFEGYHDAVDTTSSGGNDDRFNSAIRQITEDVLPDPNLIKSVVSSGGEYTSVGDVVTYTLKVSNLNPSGLSWKDVKVSDVIPDLLVFDQQIHQVTIDGLVVTPDQFNFDQQTRSLVIEVGDIMAEQEKIVTFNVGVTRNALGNEVLNKAKATGYSPQETPFIPGPAIPESTYEIIETESNEVGLPGGIVFGSLTFDSVPTEIRFGSQKIKKEKQSFSPEVIQGDLSIQDSRPIRNYWQLLARAEAFLNNGEATIPDVLRYISNGTEIVLNAESQVVMQHRNVDDLPYKITDAWSYNEGLKLTIGLDTVQKTGDFQGRIQWTLADVP